MARAQVFDALGDETRLLMFEMLNERNHRVSELRGPFGISLPATLKHLLILEAAGLITTEKVGRERICRINPQSLDEMLSWAGSIRAAWNARLDNLEAFLDDDEA